MNERRITLAGQEIAFKESEGTGQPVILVHGNSSSARVWNRLLTGAFGERFRVLAIDLPGHGDSAPAADPEAYSLPGYAAVLADFAKVVAAEDAVIVGWSLGGHIALEAASALPEAAGFVIFGTPPVSGPADMGVAFLPNPAVGVGFVADVDADQARTYAESFLVAGSTLPTDELVEDILATDGAARENLVASLQTGRFADEVEIVAALKQPIAVLQGDGEQLVNVEYLRGLAIPTLWRGAVQILPGVGHAPQVEAPEQFADVLTEFVTELG